MLSHISGTKSRDAADSYQSAGGCDKTSFQLPHCRSTNQSTAHGAILIARLDESSLSLAITGSQRNSIAKTTFSI